MSRRNPYKRMSATFLDDRRRKSIIEEIERDLLLERLKDMRDLGFDI